MLPERLCKTQIFHGLSTQVWSISEQGQARGIWTYHLKKAQYHEGPLFLRPHCGQTIEHTSYSKVSNERYVHYLSNDTPQFNFDRMVWSQCLAKKGWFLAFSSKWEKFPSTEDNFSRHLFSNYCHSVKNLLRAIKPTANGHKYPKFS